MKWIFLSHKGVLAITSNLKISRSCFPVPRGPGCYVLILFQRSSSIHVKLEKFKRGRSPSLHLAKEGDFA